MCVEKDCVPKTSGNFFLFQGPRHILRMEELATNLGKEQKRPFSEESSQIMYILLRKKIWNEILNVPNFNLNDCKFPSSRTMKLFPWPAVLE
jgi:hypothetical protein